MSSSAGLPQIPVQRPPLRRGVKEALIALAALPFLLVGGGYLGGQLGASGARAEPTAAGATTAATAAAARPAPLVTVRPAAPRPVVTVKPAAPLPVVTVEPAAPGPVVTVKPAAPAPAWPGPPFPPRATPLAYGPVAPTAPPPGPRVVLGLGSAGPDVLEWQRQLTRRHWHLAADGVFGPQSQRVARQFQAIKGLRVDGLVGRATWAAAWLRPVIL